MSQAVNSQPKSFENPDSSLPQSKEASSYKTSTLFQKTQTNLLTVEEWRFSLQNKITEIGKTNPKKASLISQSLLNYTGTQDQKDILRDLEIEVPTAFDRPGLPGGMMGGEGIIIAIIKGVIQLLIQGNKQKVQSKKEDQFVEAKIQLPNGDWITGHHEGGRILIQTEESKKTFKRKQYQLMACGKGQFISTKVKYEGGFVNSLFHDPTGEARFFIEQDTRYTGCFSEGKRSGHGALEKYDSKQGDFYLYYKGSWKEDQPETGTYYSSAGEKIAKIREGIIQANAKSFHSSSSKSSSRSNQREELEEKEYFQSPKEPKRSSKRNPCPTLSSSSSNSSPALQRLPSSQFNPNIPPEQACPLINRKLNHPHLDLNLEESITLLTTCIRYGNERSLRIADQEAVIVIGNTGSGKSTLVNYLSGCTMELKSPKELGLKGIKKVVVVRPPASGGALDEIMPIGHTKESKTFMPQIETDPEKRFTYCDCPGFLDNRGAEINIANAVNIKNALIRAAGVKIVVLINYHSLLADRGRGLNDMLKICSNLFGHADNLKRYQNSLLLGVTQVPLDLELTDLKDWLIEGTPDIMQTLAKRLFLFDPLERPLPGGWNREECLKNLQTIQPIENPSKIFRTVLTDADEKKLIFISEQMGKNIQTSLKKGQYSLAASHLRYLQSLSIIDHISVERLLSQNLYQVNRHFQKTIDDFKTHCNFEHFSSAETLYQELEKALQYFGKNLEEVINPDNLNTYYRETQTRYEERVEKEKINQEELKKAQGRIEELLQLLEEQKQNMYKQLQDQEKKFKEMFQEMQKNIKATQIEYKQMQENLQKEMREKLAQKDEELKLAQSLNQQEVQIELTNERDRLEKEYTQKLQKFEEEKRALIKEQEAQQAQREKAMEEERSKAQAKIEAIEAQKIQRVQELKASKIPNIAFGKADWERYVGKVEEELPLPPNMEEILQGPCPIWNGKRVVDTHILTLIPKTVDGNPLTLNSLEKLIQKPKGGGRATKYEYYSDYVKPLGDNSSSQSYWALMTKDVLPDSRYKTYSNQYELVKNFKKRTGINYELPPILGGVVSILMHYVKTGERLYPNNPWIYTRCQEKGKDNDPVCFGGFSADGLHIPHDPYSYCAHSSGVAGFRKFY